MNVLILAEHHQQHLQAATNAAINAGLQIADKVDVLLAGYQCKTLAETLSKISGVQQVFYLDDAVYQHLLAENLVPVMQMLAARYTHIIAPATTFGKNILPRLAAKLNMDQVSDVMQIIDANTFIRPIYAGNALVTVQCNESIKLLTIRTTAFTTACTEQSPAKIENLAAPEPNTTIEFIREEQQISVRPQLNTARVVIAGGRGLQSAENFKLLEALAEKLNAAIGASRAAVDAGFASNDYQIGQTGKMVAPELYIAVGISGAIQHIAGMKESKIIVAINKDASAPIFQIADYGLVGDLFTLLPELDKALIELK